MKKLFFGLLLIISLSFDSLKAANPASEEEYKKGMEAGKSGNLNGAVDFFTKAIQADPQNFMAYFDRGGAYEALKNKDKAVEDYAKAFELKPEFAEAATEAGTIYLLDKNDPVKAIEFYQKTLLIKNPFVDPRFTLKRTKTHTLQNLSVAYANKDSYGISNSIAQSILADPDLERSADESMRKMVRRTESGLAYSSKRNFAAELSIISKILYDKNNPTEALKQYQNFEKTHDLKTLPDFDKWDLYSGLGLAYAISQNPDVNSSAASFQKALEASHSLEARYQIETHFNLACSLSLAGKTDEALKQLENVLWFEGITPYDPSQKHRKASKISTDNDLANVRKSPHFQELLQKYSVLFKFLK